MEDSNRPCRLGNLSPFIILEIIKHLDMSDLMDFLATCRSLYELLILELHERDRGACMSIVWGAFYGLVPTLERSSQLFGLRNMALTEQHIERIFGQAQWHSFAPDYPNMAHKPNCAFDLAVGALQIEAAEWLLREGEWELMDPNKAVLSILIHMIPRNKLIRKGWSAYALPADVQPRTTVSRQLLPLLKTVIQRAGDPNLVLTCLADSADIEYTHKRRRIGVGWNAAWEYVPRPRLYLASKMLRDMPDCVFDLWLELGGDLKHLCGHTRGAIPLVQLLQVFFRSSAYSCAVTTNRDRTWKRSTGFEVPRFVLTGEVPREELPRRLQVCVKSLFKSDKRGCMWKHAPELSLAVFFLMTPDLELTRSIVENRRYRAWEAKWKDGANFIPLAVKAVFLSPFWLTSEHLCNLRRAGVDLDEPSGQHAELFVHGFSGLIVPCHGLNALHVATARKGESEALGSVEALLEAGANPHIRSPNGATVLHVAVRQGHAQLVQKFLNAGVDPFVKDLRGFTAVEVGLTRAEKLRHLPAYCSIRTMLERAVGEGSPKSSRKGRVKDARDLACSRLA